MIFTVLLLLNGIALLVVNSRQASAFFAFCVLSSLGLIAIAYFYCVRKSALRYRSRKLRQIDPF